MAEIHLILGGARSGKSRYAENLANKSGKEKIYIATASAGDDEMAARIERHKSDRYDQGWDTLEKTIDLADTIQKHANENRVVLVDCLTLWLSNCLHDKNWQPLDSSELWLPQKQRLIATLKTFQRTASDCQIILVSNETGLGVVPVSKLSRTFVDESGFMHQEIASVADRVTLVVAGLPTQLK